MSIVPQIDTSSTLAPIQPATPVKDLRFPTKHKFNESSFNLVAGDDNFTPRRELRGVETPKRNDSSTPRASLTTTGEKCAVTSSVRYNIVSPVSTTVAQQRARSTSVPRDTLLLTDEAVKAGEKPTFRAHAQRKRFERRDSDVLLQGNTGSEHKQQPLNVPNSTSRRHRSYSVDISATPVLMGGALIDERAADLNVKRNDLRAPGPCGGYGFPSSVDYNILSLAVHKEHSDVVPHVGSLVRPRAHSRQHSSPALAPVVPAALVPGPMGISLPSLTATVPVVAACS